MLITVNRETFKKAVSLAKKALSKVIIQEERGHLLIKVEKGSLSISATNNDLKARCIIAIENPSSESFSFTSDPIVLEKLLSKIDIEDVRLDYDPKEMVTKVYTGDGDKSFTSLQSFPVDKMLTFDYDTLVDGVSYIVDRQVFIYALNYAKNFLAPLKDDQKKYDFVIFNKGIVYAANGSNKMGFIVFKILEQMNNIKVRKFVLPLLVSFLGELEQDSITISETDKNISVSSEDGKFYYAFLKSNIESPNIDKNNIVSKGPYTRIDKNKLIKVIDRLITRYSTTIGVGIELTLKGSGEDSYLDLTLVDKLKTNERFPCARIEDGDTDIMHTLDYKIFKSILSSFDTDKEVRLHINEEAGFFKIYSSGEVHGHKYLLAGIGCYAKAIR